jgi:hypothetical protein
VGLLAVGDWYRQAGGTAQHIRQVLGHWPGCDSRAVAKDDASVWPNDKFAGARDYSSGQGDEAEHWDSVSQFGVTPSPSGLIVTHILIGIG